MGLRAHDAILVAALGLPWVLLLYYLGPAVTRGVREAWRCWRRTRGGFHVR
jgi:hypothetical protein